jgi:hypothetical protein
LVDFLAVVFECTLLWVDFLLVWVDFLPVLWMADLAGALAEPVGVVGATAGVFTIGAAPGAAVCADATGTTAPANAPKATALIHDFIDGTPRLQ